MMKYLPTVLILCGILIGLAPLAVGAQTSPGGIEGIENLTADGVVRIFSGLACWLTRIAAMLVFAGIIFYGVRFFLIKGDETKFAEARKNITYAFLAALIILGTFVIITTVSYFITGSGYNFTCS